MLTKHHKALLHVKRVIDETTDYLADVSFFSTSAEKEYVRFESAPGNLSFSMYTIAETKVRVNKLRVLWTLIDKKIRYHGKN